MAAAWIITDDKLNAEEQYAEYRRAGYGEGTLVNGEPTFVFKLYDDDGELYFVGKCNADAYYADENDKGALYRAWQFGMADAGAVDLRLRLKDLETLHGSESPTYAIFRDAIARPDGSCSIFS